MANLTKMGFNKWLSNRCWFIRYRMCFREGVMHRSTRPRRNMMK